MAELPRSVRTQQRVMIQTHCARRAAILYYCFRQRTTRELKGEGDIYFLLFGDSSSLVVQYKLIIIQIT